MSRYIDIALYYLKLENVMIDENSNVLFDIFNYIPPYIYDIFREKKEDMLWVDYTNDIIYELIYQDDDF
jgi:hypothetical protein